MNLKYSSSKNISIPVENFSVNYFAVGTYSSGNTYSTGITGDLLINSFTGAIVDMGGLINTSGEAGLFLTLQNLTPAIASLTGSYINRIIDGTAIIKVSSQYLSKILNVPVYREMSTSVELVDYELGSLGYHIRTGINSIITGKTTSTGNQNLFSSNVSGNIIRSTTNIFTNNGINFNGMVVNKSTSNFNFGGGALITPQDVITAYHVTPPIGTTLYFTDSNNNTSLRQVQSSVRIGNTDISVLHLNSTLDSGNYPFFKLLPSGISGNLPSSCPSTLDTLNSYLSLSDIPVIYRKLWESIWIGRLNFLDNLNGSSKFTKISAGGAYNNWYYTPIGGDSGGSMFLLVNNELVLISSFYTSDGGPAYHRYISEINSGLGYLGSSYNVSMVDLSSFNSY